MFLLNENVLKKTSNKRMVMADGLGKRGDGAMVSASVRRTGGPEFESRPCSSFSFNKNILILMMRTIPFVAISATSHATEAHGDYVAKSGTK